MTGLGKKTHRLGAWALAHPLRATTAVVLGAAFAAEGLSIAYFSSRLNENIRREEMTAKASERQVLEASSAVKRSLSLTAELHYLQSLSDFFPKDKSYLRTQKAIAGEVEALRRKLARRLRGVLYIVVDAKAGRLYLKKGFKLLLAADCSVGKGGVLRDRKTGRRWTFATPRGEFMVLAKAPDPLWRKPDWAYVEAGRKIPPPDDPSRIVHGELGAYVLSLGHGYLIHGTKNEKELGRPASHGCVRLGADDLEKLYKAVSIGTRVFIFY